MLNVSLIAAAVIWSTTPVGQGADAALQMPQQQTEAEVRKDQLRAERAERRARERALASEREQERQRGLDSFRF